MSSAKTSTSGARSQGVLAGANRDVRRSCPHLFVLLLIIVLVGGVLCAIGAVAQRAFGPDSFILIDGAWRVLQGQRPQVDFHTTLGPVTFMILALGMRLVGPSVAALGCANGVVFAFVALWAWGLSRTRMSAALSFLSALCAGFAAAGTSCYGYGYLSIPDLGYAALYNRYGEALTAILAIEVLWPLRQPGGKWESLLGGFSTGTVLVLLFFLKLNFFGMAVLGVAAGAVLVPYQRSRWGGVLLGVAIAGGLMLAYLRFDIGAVCHDVIMSLYARLGRTQSEIPRMLHALTFTLVQIYVLAVLWWIAPRPAHSGGSWLSPKVALGLKVGYVVAAELAFHWSNGQVFSSTLFAWAALLVLSNQDRLGPTEPAPQPTSPAWTSTRFLAAIPIGILLFSQVASLGYALLFRLVEFPRIAPDRKFASASMGALVGLSPSEVIPINEGLELLRRHSGAHDRILAVDYANPFSFALLRPSPTGDSLWWHLNGSYSASHYPDPAKVFANVDVVLAPSRVVPDSTVSRMLNIYGSEISRHFTPTAVSTNWVLYRRAPAKNAPAGAP